MKPKTANYSFFFSRVHKANFVTFWKIGNPTDLFGFAYFNNNNNNVWK